MCFNQRGDISTLNGSSLTFMDKVTYLGSSVSSTETDINTRLTKAWTVIDKLSEIWKSDLTDKIKCIFPSSSHVYTAIWIHYIVFANGPGDLGSIPGRVIPKTLKMELDTTLLNTQHYKVRFKGKVEQSREWSSALPYTLV